MALRATQPPGDTIQGRLAAVGIVPENGFEPIVFLSQGGKQTNHLLSEIGHRDPTSFSGELYASTGVFEQSGKDIKRDQGHLRGVTCMAFDCDLADYLGLEGDDRKALYGISLEELEGYLSAQRKMIRETFEKCNLPIHRLDVSGHGHHAYIYIDPQDRERIDDARATHKSLIAELNRASGIQLADPKVSDTGTRVTRIPGSFNNKGAVPKLVRTLYYAPDQFSRLNISATVPKQQTPVSVPEVGSVLSVKDRQNIVMALRPNWTLGQKHNLGLAVAGAFARAGVPESETADVIRELSEDDERPDDRQRSVRDTYTKVRLGSAVQGYTGLRDFLPPMACDFIDAILTRYREANTPTVDLPTKPKPEPKPVGTASDAAVSQMAEERRRDIDLVDRLKPIPDDLFYGWFSDYRTVMGPTTEAADAFHLGAMLTVVGAMVGRSIGVAQGSDTVYPNLFTILVGASGWSRKDTAIDRAMDHIRRQPRGLMSVETIEPFFAETTDITSAEGLLKELEKAKDHRLLARISEITSIFANMERPGTKNLGDRLIRLWDNPAVAQVARSTDATRIENPSFSIIAATQPGRLATSMTHEHVISGLANRGLWIAGSRKCVMYKPPAVDIKHSWKLYTELVDAVNSYKGKSLLPLSPEIDAICEEWYTRITSESLSEESESMRSRHQTLANKIALIYAVTDRSDAVYLRHMQPAIAFVEWMWDNLQILMKTWGISNFSHIQQRIEQVLRERGPLKRRTLSQACSNRRWNIAEFNAVLASLQRSDRVLIDPHGTVSLPNEEGDGHV